MKNFSKYLLFVSAACLMSSPAMAQSDLERRISDLESVVQALKAELAAEKAKTDAEIITLKKEAHMPAAPGHKKKSKSGFKVGDTTFKIGGFVDVDAHVTDLSAGSIGSGSIARDFYIPSVTPTGSGDGTTVTDITAQASRFSISAARDMGGDKATAYLELDFLGSLQGNERVSSSFAPRLRHAFIDYKGWRIGQGWSTFQNTSSIPESASFLALSDGMVFQRQPMIRYTSGNFQFAVENGNATITPASGSGRIEADTNLIPDVVARYNFKGDFGNVSLSGLGRQLRLESGATEESTFGFGVSASGRVKVGAKDDIRFNLMGGEGMGRYVGLNALNGAALNPETGELEAIPSYGGMVAYRHPFGSSTRLSLGYSALFADNPAFVADDQVDVRTVNPTWTKSVQSGFAAILWDVAPKVTMGIEGLYGVKELENGSDGSITRFTFSTKYGF